MRFRGWGFLSSYQASDVSGNYYFGSPFLINIYSLMGHKKPILIIKAPISRLSLGFCLRCLSLAGVHSQGLGV